jgi:O-antigen ligase
MKNASRIAWRYAKFSPFSAIVISAIVGISFKYTEQSNLPATVILLLALPYLCLIVAARGGLVQGKARWLPLLQFIEFPVLMNFFASTFAAQETTGDLSWGPALMTVFGLGVMSISAAIGYGISLFIKPGGITNKPSNKFIYIVTTIAAIFALLVFLG